MIIATGLTGFVGSNLISFFDKFNIHIKKIDRNNIKHLDHNLLDEVRVFIHLAGKAHDVKNNLSRNEYYQINTELTKKIFDIFLASNAKVFITLSSVKAVADEIDGELSEEVIPNPITHYGKSKLLAEQYILSKPMPNGKKFYILRPCMIHGPGNKGNLNLLYKFVSNNIPWPLGAFENKRSFCSIDNLMFILKELIERNDIPSGVYNVADDESISTKQLISLIAKSQNRKPKMWNISKGFIKGVASFGDILHLPLNTESLKKLTSSYVVSNSKMKAAIGKPFPIASRDGLIKTFKSFNR
jgi:nucleoside-diphosphate-sugar epimerase